MSAAQVEVSVLLTEREDGTTKVSRSSKGHIDVAQLAAPFASGSHTRAAGARLPLPPRAAQEALLAGARHRGAETPTRRLQWHLYSLSWNHHTRVH